MKATRYNYMGYLIERGRKCWYVLDWDYESERVTHIAKSEKAAQIWCEQ